MRGLTICCLCFAVLVSIVPETKGEEFSLVTQSLDQEYLLRISDAEAPSMEMRPGKPPLSKGRVAAEIAVGTGAGIAGGVGIGVVGGVLGAVIASDGESEYYDEAWYEFWGFLAGFAIGFLVGDIVGTAVGVYYVGNSGDEGGSFGATLLGAIGGTGIGFVMSAVGASIDNDVLALPFYIAPAIGATIGFNLTRRYDEPSLTGTSTLSQRNNAAMHSDRVFFAGRDSLRGRDFTQRINLVGMEF